MKKTYNSETVGYAACCHDSAGAGCTGQKGECNMGYNEYSHQKIKNLIERGQKKPMGNESNDGSISLENISVHEGHFMELGVSFPDFKIGEIREYYRLGVTAVEDGRYMPSYDFLSGKPEYGVAVLTSAWMDGLSKSFYGITDSMLVSRGVYKIKGWTLPVRGKCGELLVVPMDWAVKTDIRTVEELEQAVRQEEEKNGIPEDGHAVFKEEPVYFYINEGHHEYVKGIEMYNFKRPVFMDESSDWIDIMNRKKIFIDDIRARDWVTFVDKLTDEIYSSVKVPHCCYSNGMTVVPLFDCILSRIFNIWDTSCIMKDGNIYNTSDFYDEFGAYDNAEVFLENMERLVEDREPGMDIYGNRLGQEVPPSQFCPCKNLVVVDAHEGFYICRKVCC